MNAAELRRSARRGATAALGAALILVTGVLPPSFAQSPFDLAALTAELARVPAGEATFVERRRVEMLDRTIESSGRLTFRAPDRFTRETLKPRRELLSVAGNTLTMAQGERTRTVQLDAVPEAAVIVEAIRGVLTGNRPSLERVFETRVGGDARRWTLDLVPRDARLRGQVASIRVSGGAGVVRQVQILLADGDRSTMTIEPVK